MTGEELFSKGNEHVGERYVLGAHVPKNKANFDGPWDCAEFVSWVVFQKINKLYGCENDSGNPATADAYTGYWARDVAALGLAVTIEEAACRPGGILLRVPPKEGVPGHIVICDGKGGTIEAHSTNSGVINAAITNRRWDHGVLLPEITYTELAPVAYTAPQTTVFRVTSPMMSGSKVTEIQQKLTDLGFDTNGVDGVFGNDTASAASAFQNANGLVADGEVGKETAAALNIVL